MTILPETQHFVYYDAPDGSQEFMEFRLIYRGHLPAEGRGGGRAKEKQFIRKGFHKQLRELWKQQPDLRAQSENRFVNLGARDETFYLDRAIRPGSNIIVPATGSLAADPGAKTWMEHIAEDHQRCGGRFVPLVTKAGGFTCSLDILFLRRDNPGGLIVKGADGGDIDNRIKVLFDGLKMPETVSDLGGLPLESDENPFFCLLEDDSLITSVTITTDRLLLERDSEEKRNDVYLIIHVTVLNPSALFAGNRLA
jgi:hypothetical protein